jgi:hypothetical protein
MSYIDFNGQTMAIGRASYGGDSSDVSGDLSGVVNIYSTVGAFAALKGDGSVVTWGGIEGLMAYNYWTTDTSTNLIYLPESGGASRVGVNVLNPTAFLDASGSFYLGEHSSWDFTGVDFTGSDLYGRSSIFNDEARRNVRKIVTGERFTLTLYNDGTVRFFTTASIVSLGGLIGISGETGIVDIATQNYTVPIEDTCIVATYRNGRAKAWTYTNTESFIEDLSNSTLFFKGFSVGSTFYLGTHKIITVGYGSSNSTSIAAQYFRNATEYTVQVLNLLIENHRQIEIGQNFVATLRNDGTILMYFVYDLFDNNRFSNVAYNALRNIVKISCGKDHVLALDSCGNAYAYAHNLIIDDRITGVGALSDLSSIYIRQNVKDIYAGGEFSVLLLQDNTIVACGSIDVSSGSYSNKLAIFAGNDTVFMKEQVEHNRLNGYTLIRDHVHIGENHGLFSEEHALAIYDVNRSGLPGSIYLGGNGNRNYSRIILGDNSISPSPIQTLWSIEHKRGNLSEDHHFRLGFYKDGIENNVLMADTCGNIRLGYTEDLEYYPYRLAVKGSEYIDGDLTITGTTQFGSGFRFANNVLFVSGTQVGIMTSSPSSGITLDVNGSQRITGNIIVIGNADFRNQVSFSSGFSVGNFFSVSPVGVGVGKINPNVALDVVGSATISTDIQAETANITTSITTPRIGLGRSNARYPLDVSGRGFVSGNMEIGGLASIGKTITGTTALDVSGASIVSGSMTVGKTTETFISGLDVSGSTLVSGRMTIGKTALTSGIALDVSGTTVLSGNVGIGKATSLNALDVSGTVLANTLSATSIIGSLSTASQPNITSIGTLSSLNVSGNVGIGKASTSNALDVSGTVLANTLSATSILGTISTTSQPNITSLGTLSSLNVSGTAAATTICGTTLTGTISTTSQPNITSLGTLNSLNVSGTSGLIGNVGIGRAATSNTIDISGTARISGATTICGTLFVNDISGFRGSQWETSGNTISYRTGNVGIGTSIPSVSLDISGTTRISGSTTICGTLFVNDISGFRGSQWTNNGNNIYYQSGSVGIGRTDPSAAIALDISGSVRSNNFMFVKKFEENIPYERRISINNNVNAVKRFGAKLYIGGSFTEITASNVSLVDGEIIRTDTYNVGYIAAIDLSNITIDTLNSGLDGTVNAIEVFNNLLWVGGNFSSFIASWDTSSWTQLPGLDGPCYVLHAANNQLYVGGFFYSANGIISQGIARILYDNISAYYYSNVCRGVNGECYAIAYHPSYGLIVGGYFSSARNSSGTTVSSTRNIARTTTNSTWTAIAGGFGSSGMYQVCKSIALYGSSVIIGGYFTRVGSLTTLSNIAIWNGGSFWSNFGGGLSDTCNVMRIINDNLYVGGYFLYVNSYSISANRIAIYNLTTGIWSALGSGITGNYCSTIDIDGDDVYIGGDFTSVNNLSGTGKIAKWNGSTLQWSAFSSQSISNNIRDGIGVGKEPTVELDVSGEVKLLGDMNIDGNFTIDDDKIVINTATFRYILTLSSTLSIFPFALAYDSNQNVLYIGGLFNIANVQKINKTTNSVYSSTNYTVSNIISISTIDGTVNTFAGGTNSWVYSICIADSSIYVGGEFTNRGNYIARWDNNNSTWNTLDTGVNGAVLNIVAYNSGVFVGGNFTDKGNYIAYWSGSSWSTLGTGLNAICRKSSIVGTSLYVGGDFTIAGSNSANYVAMWNISTSSWAPLGSGLNAQCYAMDISASNLYVGGSFNTAGGATSNFIARWNTSDQTWYSVGSGSENGINGICYAIVVSGNDVYVGGLYSLAGTVSVSSLARWDISNSTWNQLGTPSNNGINNSVRCLTAFGNILYVGGDFTSAANTPYTSYIAAWNNSSSSWGPIERQVETGLLGISKNPAVELDVKGDASITGRVGIGMTNPITSFQIALPDATAGSGVSLGDVGAWDSTYALISRTTSTSGSGAGALGLGYNNSMGSGVITCLAPGDSWKNINYKAANHLFVGNMGIGTSSPSTTLDVNGTTRITGTTTICGTLFVRDISGVSSQWTTSGNNITYTTGNVGIGKTNPTSALDIRGRLAVSSNTSYSTLSQINILPMIDSSYTHIWTTRTSAADNSWRSVCWSPELSLFVATGDSGTGNRVMTSLNGINWTTRSTVGIDSNYYGIAWSPSLSLFVIVGATNVLTSSDGITWTLRSLPNSFAFFNWTSVCWSPELGLFAAVASTSNNGTSVMTSPDGINWTGRSTVGFDNAWQSICWSPQLSLFVAVANSGTGNRVMTSSNGINWATQNTTGLDNTWQSVCWSPELSLFVAVSTNGTGNRVMTSSNGTSWALRTSAADNNWQSVCWSSELSLFVAVSNTGTGNRVMTSSNGTSWTTRTSSVDNAWSSICWSPQLSMFAVVANSGTGNRVMTSSGSVIPSNNFGSCYLYSNPTSLGRGIIPSAQYFRLNTNLTGLASASAQTLLGAGVLLASNTVYEFEGLFDLSRSATTSATISLSFDTSGGMVVNNILYHVITTTTDNSANTATTSTMTINTTSAIAITGALALSHRFVINRIVGTISIGSTGGRLTPMYTVSTNAFSFNTRAGSFFKIWPIGASGSNISIGNWA